MDFLLPAMIVNFEEISIPSYVATEHNKDSIITSLNIHVCKLPFRQLPFILDS